MTTEAIFVCIYFQLKVILTIDEVKWQFSFSFDFELVDQQVENKSICTKVIQRYGSALTSSTCDFRIGYAKFVSHDMLLHKK